MKSWRTTVAGVLLIVVAVGKAAAEFLQGGSPDLSMALAQIMTAIGLIKAADSSEVKQ